MTLMMVITYILTDFVDNKQQTRFAYMQGYNRVVLGTGHDMESYIEFIKQSKKD